jgi:predicted membrane protein
VLPSGLDAETIHAVLRSVSLRVAFEPPEIQRVVTVMGNVVLDYRQAEFPPGITAIDCRVVLGNVEILVPPDVDVELTGSVLLGNVETIVGGPRSSGGRVADGPVEEPERPLLSVDCSGVMGNVEVRLF